MDTESWWKSRTVNEAISHGTYLRLTCPGCSKITDFPFALLLQKRGVTRDSFLGNIRFKCEKCGRAEPALSVQSHTTAPGQITR